MPCFQLGLFIIAAILFPSATCIITTSPTEFLSYSFDFIIVGGGTAGLPLATRLSDNGGYTVGVIDSGEYRKDDPLVTTPANFGAMVFNPNYDHMFPSVPQTGLNNGARLTVRGKVLGGSSATNFELWSRASKEEYDILGTFAEDGWDWRDLVPYFAKTEDYRTLFGNQPRIRRILFYINMVSRWILQIFMTLARQILPTWIVYEPHENLVTDNPPYYNFTEPFVNAMKAGGIPPNRNPDSGEISGVWNAPSSVDRQRGIRMSSVSAYLEPNVNRTNLVVLTSSKATKLILDGNCEPFLARGVEFLSRNVTYKVNARLEVILSAGAIQTPQLLEYSGIGNPAIISQFGIPSLVDLTGVGENLQDHLSFMLLYATKPDHHSFDLFYKDSYFAAEQQKLYDFNRTGILSTTWSTVVFSTLQSIFSNETLDRLLTSLDVEISSRQLSSRGLTSLQYAIQRRWLEGGRVTQWEALLGNMGLTVLGQPATEKELITVFVPQLHPFSRGNVHISSSDPLSLPLIDYKFLEYEFDAKVLVTAAQFVHNTLSNHAPFMEIIDELFWPKADVMANNEEAMAFLRNTALTISHPVGTSPLAPRSMGGVVDSQLKVYGLSNVRIVDASVITMQLSTHPQATVYAIAEKAADMILDVSQMRDEF